MNTQPEPDITVNWDLNAPGATKIIHDNLDNPEWRRTHIPEVLSWIRSRSITLLGDSVVACILHCTDVTPAEVHAHIKNTWHKDMKNKPKLKDSVQLLHGVLPGDAPPPPPLTMFSHFFQLNAKYGMSV